VTAEWLRPLKVREYCVDHCFDDLMESERQLYMAVIRGELRARHKGRQLGARMVKAAFENEIRCPNPFTLPPDIELSVEDAKGIWGVGRSRLC
jgi:hypothetical protein